MRLLSLLLCLAVAFACLFGTVGLTIANDGQSDTSPLDRALHETERGRFGNAVNILSQAVNQYEAAGNDPLQLKCLIQLGSVQQRIGAYARAEASLGTAIDLAERSEAHTSLVMAKNALAVVYTYMGRTDEANQLLNEALALAGELNQIRAAAHIQNNFGNLRVAQQRYVDAVEGYLTSAQLALAQGENLLASRAGANAALYAAQAGAWELADQLCDQIPATLADVEASAEKAAVYLSLAHADVFLMENVQEQRTKSLARSHRACSAAIDIAEQLGDQVVIADAMLSMSGLYESEGRHQEARVLAGRAAFASQRGNSNELLFRSQWKLGRQWVALGDKDSALRAYTLAVATLQDVRSDLSTGFGTLETNRSFRQADGRLFFELADLLFMHADDQADPDAARRHIKQARDTVELLKSAEMADYFGGDCLSLLRNKARSVDEVSKTAAIIYVVPLEDRVELLVDYASGLKRYTSTVTGEQLAAVASQFRLFVETRGTNEHRLYGKQLYNWLVRPLEQDLQQLGIDTLVFVPDGALRTIPMAALHDGEQFLIQKYAVAVTPGLELMDPQPIDRSRLELLLNGVSESVQGFAPLPFVEDELEVLGDLFDSKQLLNSEFNIDNIRQEMVDSPYRIVHVASHGEFNRDVDKSFLLTYEDKLTLDGLERLIRPSQFQGNPVELITLSACQTAAGDDRAALGMAGVAIKAGARSALASLWSVSDIGTSMLIYEFYSKLRDDATISKAKALREAQLKLIDERDFNHPYYWAAFIMIGNWL